MAELVFFSGTMDCGNSTLALQTDHNHSARGRAGIVFTALDRAGEDTLSSRLGLKVPAVEVPPELDFWQYVVDVLESGGLCDYLICDEAQFYTPAQVGQTSVMISRGPSEMFWRVISTRPSCEISVTKVRVRSSASAACSAAFTALRLRSSSMSA